MTVDFSSEILPEAMREQQNILQLLKEKKDYQSSILYPVRILQKLRENQDILR